VLPGWLLQGLLKGENWKHAGAGHRQQSLYIVSPWPSSFLQPHLAARHLILSICSSCMHLAAVLQQHTQLGDGRTAGRQR
jgi:hypothetical protein